MTPERARAYERVIQTLKEMGPSKLLGDEEPIRYGADNLSFNRDLAQDAPARAVMGDIERLGRLVESERWEQGAPIRTRQRRLTRRGHPAP